MRRLFGVITAVGLLAGTSHAATTRDGFACVSKEVLETMVKATVQGDDGTQIAILRDGRCFKMRGGLTITVTDYPGVFDDKVGFVFQGVKFWTLERWVNF